MTTLAAKPEDRRKSARKKVMLTAELFDSDGQHLSSCLVRDASETGCLLISTHVRDWPKKVVLKFRESNHTRKARIVWRDTKAAGVEFV